MDHKNKAQKLWTHRIENRLPPQHFRTLEFFVLKFDFCFISSEVYCRGDLLHTVQMAKLYNDSKTFVDMKMKVSPQNTLDSFREFMEKHDNKPTKEDIRQFVNVSYKSDDSFFQPNS